MKKNILLRWAAAMLALVAVFALFAGCGDDAEESKTDAEIMEQQGVPDIFIEESQQLTNQDTPPALVLETTQGETVSATNATLGGYAWEWMDSSGKIRFNEEEAPCAAEMKDIAVISRASCDGKVALRINGGTLRSVQIWGEGAPMEEGEKITVENETIVFPGQGEYRYEVVVEYAGGRVYYAFRLSE